MATTNLTADERAFLAAARTATLATIAPDGWPRLVPICFVVGADARRPTACSTARSTRSRSGSSDPRDLARVRDILARPDVALLVDRWSEDWSQLGWLRTRRPSVAPRTGRSAPAEHAAAVAALRAKYPQYADAPPRGPADHPDRASTGQLAGQPRGEPRASAVEVERLGVRPEAVGRAHRLVVAAGVEQRDDVALADRRHRVVLGEHVARLVDVAGDGDDLGPRRVGGAGRRRSPGANR